MSFNLTWSQFTLRNTFYLTASHTQHADICVHHQSYKGSTEKNTHSIVLYSDSFSSGHWREKKRKQNTVLFHLKHCWLGHKLIRSHSWVVTFSLELWTSLPIRSFRVMACNEKAEFSLIISPCSTLKVYVHCGIIAKYQKSTVKEFLLVIYTPTIRLSYFRLSLVLPVLFMSLI